MDKQQQKAFLTELASLLNKYNAEIGFTCSECSDTHGLYDDHLTINIRLDNRDILNIFNSDGWGIDAKDILSSQELKKLSN